jgi:hypothetical protein
MNLTPSVLTICGSLIPNIVNALPWLAVEALKDADAFAKICARLKTPPNELDGLVSPKKEFLTDLQKKPFEKWVIGVSLVLARKIMLVASLALASQWGTNFYLHSITPKLITHLFVSIVPAFFQDYRLLLALPITFHATHILLDTLSIGQKGENTITERCRAFVATWSGRLEMVYWLCLSRILYVSVGRSSGYKTVALSLIASFNAVRNALRCRTAEPYFFELIQRIAKLEIRLDEDTSRKLDWLISECSFPLNHNLNEELLANLRFKVAEAVSTHLSFCASESIENFKAKFYQARHPFFTLLNRGDSFGERLISFHTLRFQYESQFLNLVEMIGQGLDDDNYERSKQDLPAINKELEFHHAPQFKTIVQVAYVSFFHDLAEKASQRFQEVAVIPAEKRNYYIDLFEQLASLEKAILTPEIKESLLPFTQLVNRFNQTN